MIYGNESKHGYSTQQHKQQQEQQQGLCHRRLPTSIQRVWDDLNHDWKRMTRHNINNNNINNNINNNKEDHHPDDDKNDNDTRRYVAQRHVWPLIVYKGQKCNVHV